MYGVGLAKGLIVTLKHFFDSRSLMVEERLSTGEDNLWPVVAHTHFSQPPTK